MAPPTPPTLVASRRSRDAPRSPNPLNARRVPAKPGRSAKRAPLFAGADQHGLTVVDGFRGVHDRAESQLGEGLRELAGLPAAQHGREPQLVDRVDTFVRRLHGLEPAGRLEIAADVPEQDLDVRGRVWTADP